MGVFQSGQMGQTVNLLSFDFGGSNPSAPTHKEEGLPNRQAFSFYYSQNIQNLTYCNVLTVFEGKMLAN